MSAGVGGLRIVGTMASDLERKDRAAILRWESGPSQQLAADANRTSALHVSGTPVEQTAFTFAFCVFAGHGSDLQTLQGDRLGDRVGDGPEAAAEPRSHDHGRAQRRTLVISAIRVLAQSRGSGGR